MKFSDVVEQASELLQRRGRLTYRTLKREFDLDDAALEDLKFELIEGQQVAADEGGKVLVWKGASAGVSPASTATSPAPSAVPSATLAVAVHSVPEAERRQLTVMFIDLVGSTTLSQQLDPEDYHARVVDYQTACQRVIAHYEGHIAQYLGDGVLVYFGYPVAHEDAAVRAVRSSLEIVAAVSQLAFTPPLQVRIGIHTGPVVVGEIGAGERTERLALGETPNIAARVQGHAAPNTVFISATTHQLVQGLFECRELGAHTLKGISAPLSLYQVVREEAVHSRFDVAVRRGLTPLIGREHEVGLLAERWERAKQAEGQVVLLGGEPGIGKSRLVQVMRERAERDAARRLEFRCSPYHQNSAFYPILEHLQRLLQFTPSDSTAERLGKLEQTLTSYQFPQADTVPLMATLLSLPHPEKYPALTFSPQRQKQKTQEVLVAWVVEEAARQALYCPWEDIHWADPSTLELLTLLIDQVPTARLYLLLTFRPEFVPSWGTRSHLSHLTLGRLGRNQVTHMIERIAGDRTLPAEILQQIVAKTDGVPLFVEELTKVVLESVESLESNVSEKRRLLQAIPVTLHDSLMARLDRLGTAKEVAQLGATLGREFSYELLQAIAPLDEETLQRGLSQLVGAELLYQRGVPPRRQYIFKHALIQDTAYQSLLKSKRQQYHRQIAQVLEEQFSDTKETQPELLAQHYTEAGLLEQAISYWQKAGQRASQRSAHAEAITHLTTGLDLLKLLPATPERTQQELRLQIALGTPLMATKGSGALDVKRTYDRALELCRQVGETPQLFSVLGGLCAYYGEQAELQTAQELAEQLLRLAQGVREPLRLVWAHRAVGAILFRLGEWVSARTHLEQSVALYDPRQHRSYGFVYDPGVSCLPVLAHVLWHLGYPDQALKRSDEALTLAQALSHPYSLTFAIALSATLHHNRGERQTTQERAESMLVLSSEQGFPLWLAVGTIWQGWTLTERGQGAEGIAQMRQGLTAYQATAGALGRPYYLLLLAEACGKVGQPEEGLAVLAEALAVVDGSGAQCHKPELYRLKGELLLKAGYGTRKDEGKTSSVRRSPFIAHQSAQAEAEACFLKAIEIARKQQVKSLELRAVMSLSRLWQPQDKQKEAHNLLSEIYNWFTEGFDTKDLQEAKALLEELAEGQ